MTKPRKPKYSGVLNDPITLPAGGLLDDEKSLARQRVESGYCQYRDRVRTLLEYYGLDPKDKRGLEKLALLLAKDHVPGFHVHDAISGRSAGAGRPQQWSSVRYCELYADVLALQRKKPGLSRRGACRILSQRKRYQGLKLESLNQRFKEALDPNRNPFARLILAEKERGAPIDDWLIEYFSVEA